MMTEQKATSLPVTQRILENGDKYNETDFQIDHVTTATSSVIVLISLLGLVGNGIVLWFLGFRIKRNPFTVYVLNLAAADFGCLFCLSVSLTINVLRLSRLLLLMMCLDLLFLFMLSTSLYLLTAISADRCVSVLFPIWHRCRRPTHLSAIVCALLWALSCLLTGVRFFVCFLDSSKHCFLVVTDLTATNFLIFTPIMVLSSLILIIKVQCSSQRRPPGKLYVVILLTILFFLIFVAPLSIVTFFHNVFSHYNLITIILMLASMNSSINPVIYFFVGSYRNRQFRRSVKKAFHSVFEEEAARSKGRVSATEIPTGAKLEDPIMS